MAPINASWNHPWTAPFEDKIFNKHQGGLKIKVSIFMNVFEVCQLPPWVVAVHFGRWPSYLGGDHPIWVVTTLLVELTLLGNGLVYPKMDGHLPKRMVTNHKGWSPFWKTSFKKWWYYFDPMSMFVNFLSLKIV